METTPICPFRTVKYLLAILSLCILASCATASPDATRSGRDKAMDIRGASMTAEPIRVIEARGSEPIHALEVREVEPDGPAKQAGLQAGDIILRVNGEPAEEFAHWTVSRIDQERGKPVVLEGFRGADNKEWKLVLGPVQHELVIGVALWSPPLFNLEPGQFEFPGTLLWYGYGCDAKGFWIWPLGGYAHILETRSYFVGPLIIRIDLK